MGQEEVPTLPDASALPAQFAKPTIFDKTYNSGIARICRRTAGTLIQLEITKELGLQPHPRLLQRMTFGDGNCRMKVLVIVHDNIDKN